MGKGFAIIWVLLPFEKKVQRNKLIQDLETIFYTPEILNISYMLNIG